MPQENSAHHKLFKVQPLLNHVVQNCGMELKQERDLSVDKATVKFKGHSRYETAHANEAGEIGNQSVGFNKKHLAALFINFRCIQGKDKMTLQSRT